MMKITHLSVCVVLFFAVSFLDAKSVRDSTGDGDGDGTGLSFPMIYKWSKRNHEKTPHGGCMDPTEPFQCPGSNICISLQFLCDGHPGDCPNNYDENQGLCTSAKRPPKDSIRTLLSAQTSTYGSKFIEYLFGSKALSLYNSIPHMEALNVITIALSVSPTIEDFGKVLEMTDIEMRRFENVLVSLNTGQVDDLPPFIVNSAGEGLSTLAHQLIKTNFLQND